MSFETDIRDAALETLTELGTTATLRRIARVYNPATGIAAETPTDHAVVASPPAPLSVGPRRETTVAEATCYAFLAAKDAPTTPQLFDTLTIAGLVLRVVDVKTYYGGASIACWQLFLGA